MTELKVMSWAGRHRFTSPLSAGIAADDLLWLSGQVPIDLDTGAIVNGDITVQTERVFDNLAAVLAANGSGLERIVRCTVFLTNQADFDGMDAVYSRRLRPPYPARSTVIIRLTRPAYRLEIDAIAYRGQGAPT